MHVLQPSQRVNGSEDNHFPWGQQRPAAKLNKAARKGDSKSILGQDVKKVVGESKIKYLITKQTHPVDLSKVMMIKNCKKATASGSDKLHSLQIKCNQLSPCTPGLLTSLSCSRCRWHNMSTLITSPLKPTISKLGKWKRNIILDTKYGECPNDFEWIQ
jgi:hypothetical protein